MGDDVKGSEKVTVKLQKPFCNIVNMVRVCVSVLIMTDGAILQIFFVALCESGTEFRPRARR